MKYPRFENLDDAVCVIELEELDRSARDMSTKNRTLIQCPTCSFWHFRSFSDYCRDECEPTK